MIDTTTTNETHLTLLPMLFSVAFAVLVWQHILWMAL
jgi:hypothetical protein